MADDPSETIGGPDVPAVVDLASIRIGRGLATKPRCLHHDLVYVPTERRIFCRSCASDVDAYDAFMVLTNHFAGMSEELSLARARIDQDRAAVLVRKAAKAADKVWNAGMAPCCPHCMHGILPDDVLNGAAVSIEFEAARRARDHGSP